MQEEKNVIPWFPRKKCICLFYRDQEAYLAALFYMRIFGADIKLNYYVALCIICLLTDTIKIGNKEASMTSIQ